MEVLPTEVVSSCILSLLPVKDLATCSSVCNWMHDMSEDQYLWKQLVLRDFGKLYISRDTKNFKEYWKTLTIKKRIAISSHSCAKAAGNGDLLALRALHEQGRPWSENAHVGAARGGHLHILKYLHDKGCPRNEWACSAAAHAGQLECLKFLHDKGCPWNERTCANASRGGQLECLKYLHKQGCPWNEWTCNNAFYGGNKECLEYAREQECPEDL